METHFKLLMTIDNLASASISNFTERMRGGLVTPLRKRLSVLGRVVKPRSLSSRSCHLRDTIITHTAASVNPAIARVNGPGFCCSRDRIVAKLFFGSEPILDIVSLFVAAL